jgi:hypothetical protein
MGCLPGGRLMREKSDCSVAYNSEAICGVAYTWFYALETIRILYGFVPAALLRRGKNRNTERLAEARFVLIGLWLQLHGNTPESTAVAEAWLLSVLGVSQKTVSNALRRPPTASCLQAERLYWRIRSEARTEDIPDMLASGILGKYKRHGILTVAARSVKAVAR